MKPVLALFLAVSAACASTTQPKETRSRLPFRVALVPLTLEDMRTDRLPRDEGKPTDMKLPTDRAFADRMSESVRKALEERAFTQVTLLSSADEEHAVTEADWVALARSSGADLLLRVEMSMQPVVRQEKNGKFWLNLPLFLIGGPFCWFVPDHTYYADAELLGWFYDVNRLVGDDLDTSLRGSRNDIADASRTFERQDLDFLDRAQGHVGRLAASVLIPSGFLASENTDLEDDFVDLVVADLSRGFASSVLDQKSGIQGGRAPYFLDLDASGVAPGKDGTHRLSAEIYLDPAGEYEEMGSYCIRIGDAEGVEREFRGGAAVTSEGRYRRYSIEEPITIQDGELVHLIVVAGDRQPVSRSYTFHASE